MVKVKICGLTNLDDALFAANQGADYLGFIFYEKSPRYLDIQKAASIIKGLPEGSKKVGVFVNQPEAEINQTVKACGLDYVQLHGEESPGFAGKISVPVIKSFRLKDKSSFYGIEKYDVVAYLFDSFNEESYGGTGKTFDMSLLQGSSFSKPFFLSGGLTSENVGQAIKNLKPYAVDVASGVEKSPGLKDHHKVEKFIQISSQLET